MATSSLEEMLARLRTIQASPHNSGWDSRARMEAISAFVDFHYGTRRKGNLTEAFVTLLIRAVEHELKVSQERIGTSGETIKLNKVTEVTRS
jgi:hypothetical protein